MTCLTIKSSDTNFTAHVLQNLLELASEVETRRCNSLAMVQCRVQRELQRVDVRKWIDEDLNADLQYLTDALALCVQDFRYDYPTCNVI